MLDAIRRGTRSWAMKAILVLIVASFAIWGVGDIFRSGTGQTVATVGETQITASEFVAEFQREMTRQSQNRDQPLTRQDALQKGLDKRVLNRLVLQEIFAKAARGAGLRVPDSVVLEEIQSMSIFQSELGFDRFAFQSFLRQTGMSEGEFMDVMRNDVARRQLINAVTGPVQAPQAMANAFYRYQEERRSARYVEIPNAAVTVPDPTEKALRAFYKANPEMFRAPEYRSFTVARLSPDDLAAEIAVAEKEMRQYYKRNKGRYTEPARRHIQQIVIQDKAEAQAVAKKLEGEAGFKTLAKKRGRSESDIDLGIMTRQELAGVDPAVAKAAFALEKPGIAGPVQTDFGWHILNVTDIQPGQTQSFEEVRGEIRKELARDEAVDAVYDLGVRVEDALAAGTPLKDVAAKFDLRVREYESVAMSGVTRDGEVPEPAPSQQVLDTAFNTKPGAYLELQETEEGGYYIVQVDGVTPASVRPFDSAKAQVRKAYLKQERQAAAEKRAATLRKKITGGTTLEAAAKKSDIIDSVQTAANVGRNGQNAPTAFGQQALEALFSAGKGGVVTAPGAGGNSQIVMALAKISPANPGANPKATQSIADALQQVLANNLLAQYRQALYERYDVQLFPGVAAQALGQSAQL